MTGCMLRACFSMSVLFRNESVQCFPSSSTMPHTTLFSSGSAARVSSSPGGGGTYPGGGMATLHAAARYSARSMPRKSSRASLDSSKTLMTRPSSSSQISAPISIRASSLKSCSNCLAHGFATSLIRPSSSQVLSVSNLHLPKRVARTCTLFSGSPTIVCHQRSRRLLSSTSRPGSVQ